MVTAVQIRDWFERRIEEKRWYLLDVVRLTYYAALLRERVQDVAEVVRVRYGDELSSLVEKIRTTERAYMWYNPQNYNILTVDTKEPVFAIIERYFEDLCLGLVTERAQENVSRLSEIGAVLLHSIYKLVMLRNMKRVRTDTLQALAEVILGRRIPWEHFRDTLKDLCSCYVIDIIAPALPSKSGFERCYVAYFPLYIGKLLEGLKGKIGNLVFNFPK